MKRFTLFIFLLNFSICYSQEYSKYWNDLNYAGDSLEYHNLDIYLPVVEKPAYPVVISIYGSAWFGNDLKGTDLATIGKALLASGFAIVTANHRSSMDAKFPAQINDIKAVIRFIRANAEEYQIDTSFIGITGSSSGGHLAALAGTSGFVKQFTVGSDSANIEGTIGAYLAYNSSVDAIVDWFGPTDFLVMDSCGSNLDHDADNSPESTLIGGPIQDNPDKCALANPITYIDANDPPFLILHGDADPLVPYCQSDLLFKALQNANVPSQYILVPEAQHGPGLFEDEYFKMMTDFFTEASKITGLNFESGNNSLKFSFSQNYPNPFNPITTITFTLPLKSSVTLEVFDSLGQKVAKIYSGEMLPGTYSRQWNAEGLPSGEYFLRLQARSYIETKKLVLLK